MCQRQHILMVSHGSCKTPGCMQGLASTRSLSCRLLRWCPQAVLEVPGIISSLAQRSHSSPSGAAFTVASIINAGGKIAVTAFYPHLASVVDGLGQGLVTMAYARVEDGTDSLPFSRKASNIMRAMVAMMGSAIGPVSIFSAAAARQLRSVLVGIMDNDDLGELCCPTVYR